jgi:hypothetical protein
MAKILESFAALKFLPFAKNAPLGISGDHFAHVKCTGTLFESMVSGAITFNCTQ